MCLKTRIQAYGINMEGVVYFHNGFVVKIGSVHILDAKFKDLSDATKVFISSTVILENVEVTYELDCELEEFESTATQVYLIDGLEFTASISKDHSESSQAQTVFKFENIFGGIFKMSIKNYPSNPFTQIIAREVEKKVLNYSYLKKFMLIISDKKSCIDYQSVQQATKLI